MTPTKFMQAFTPGTGYPGSWVVPAAADNESARSSTGIIRRFRI
jgi:hypothetical protein